MANRDGGGGLSNLRALGTATGMTLTVIAWGVLVFAAIDFGRTAREGSGRDWILLVAAAVGAIAGPLGITLGSLSGAILGGLAGGVGGCALGAQLGDQLDRHVLANNLCLICGHRFNLPT